MMTETVVTLEVAIQEMSSNLARLRTRHSELAVEIYGIGDSVRHGDASRASDTAELIRQQNEVAETIRNCEQELLLAKLELKHVRDNVNKAEVKELLDRMRTRRQRIIDLCRLASVELGTLYGEDREQGLRLVPAVFGSLAQQEFMSLLEPIDPFRDEWADRHREVVIDVDNCTRLRPMQKL